MYRRDVDFLPVRALWVSVAVLVAAAGIGYIALRDVERFEALQEFVFQKRFAKYDSLIGAAAGKNGISPNLVKAVVWRETRFRSDAAGTRGERGLMQVTEPAASEWAAAEGIETFSPEDLFDPKVNLDAGTWYLARALRHWAHMDDPVPFALAEYNAGRSRVRRWVDAGANSAKELEAVIDFPSTKEYIASIMRRYRLYLERGEFDEKPGGQF